MEHDALLTCLIVASAGFVLWYYLSTTLRIPVRYQIMFDANPPYVNRIFRRRLLGMILYVLIPIVTLKCLGWDTCPMLSELGIAFHWNHHVMKLTLIGVAGVLIMAFFSTRQEPSLEIYPEIRVRFWRPYIVIMSALTWIGYIFAYEFFYRGLLFKSFLHFFEDSPEIAIAATTALYGLTHYFKLNRLTIFSFVWGVLACIIVLKTDSLWPVIITHTCLSLFFEWFSIYYHREMHMRKT